MLKKYFTKVVDSFPNVFKDGVIYYDEKKSRSVHLCPCECGEEIWLSHYAYGWKLSVNKKNEISIVTPIENKKCDSVYTIRQGYSFDERMN